MSEWWTYRLDSFLMFAPRTYARLVEQTNADAWPLQPLAVALGLAALVLAWRARSCLQQRLVWAGLAGAWLWVAWAFLHQRFMVINWAAEYVAWAWGAQGLALAWLGAVRGRLGGRYRTGVGMNAAAHAHAATPVPGFVRVVGAALVLTALLAWPLLGRLWGGAWAASHIFGVMPDPTALATLGFLLLLRPPWWLFAVPLLSCALGGALSWALQAPLPWLSPALGALAAACAWYGRQARPVSARPG